MDRITIESIAGQKAAYLMHMAEEIEGGSNRSLIMNEVDYLQQLPQAPVDDLKTFAARRITALQSYLDELPLDEYLRLRIETEIAELTNI